MFFSRSNLEKVLRGKKTQTRRLSDKYQVGYQYNIRTWIYEKGLARIRIIGKRKERLGAISAEDLKREGYDNIEDFKKAWVNFYAKKMGWHPELKVWVYDFVLVEAPVGHPLPPLKAYAEENYVIFACQRTLPKPKKKRLVERMAEWPGERMKL